MIQAIAILSGFLQFLGYVVYSKHVFGGKIAPNTASWSIWSFGAILESSSYVFLTNDALKNILPFVCALSAVLFFVICLYRGHFGAISRFEKAIVGLDVCITIIWFVTKSPLYANILLVITAIISFIPIIFHVFKNPTSEDAFPWFIWSSAYALQTYVVFERFEKEADFVYPVVFFVLHVVVSVLALDVRKRKNDRKLPNLAKKVFPEHL